MRIENDSAFVPEWPIAKSIRTIPIINLAKKRLDNAIKCQLPFSKFFDELQIAGLFTKCGEDMFSVSIKTLYRERILRMELDRGTLGSLPNRLHRNSLGAECADKEKFDEFEECQRITVPTKVP